MNVATIRSGGRRSSSLEARYLTHNISTAAGVFLAETGTKRRLRSPLGRISTISLSRFFHSPASPEDPPWARACRRRIASGVTAIRLFREKIQSSAARYPASSSSERSRGLAPPNHERPQPVRRDGDALDSIRRFGALDDRLFPQYSQDFRLLSEPEVLLSTRFHADAEKPAGPDRNRQVRQSAWVERQHVQSPDDASSLIMAIIDLRNPSLFDIIKAWKTRKSALFKKPSSTFPALRIASNTWPKSDGLTGW